MVKLHHPHPGLLVVRRKKQAMVPITKDLITIGRKHADILLDDPGVSSTHAEIRKEGQKIILIDLQSTNGTLVNRKPVTQCELSDQDVIEIGTTSLCFYSDLREFRGHVEENHIKSKDDPDTNSKEVVTTTKTLILPQCVLRVMEGPDEGKTFSFRKSHILIGRRDADLVLMDADVSRAHAMIELLSARNLYIRDLNSTNGTYVNGQKIQAIRIQSGDEISVGNSTLNLALEETQ